MLSIVPKGNISDDKWNVFVDDCSAAWLLHRSEMLDAFNAWEFNVDISFAVQDGDEIVGVCPLLVKQIPYKRFFHINYLDSAGGLALADDLSPGEQIAVRDKVKKYLQSLSRRWFSPRITILISGLAPSFDADSNLLLREYDEIFDEACSTHSYHVNLEKSIEDLWASMLGRSRTAIRKAQKSGVVVRMADCSETDLNSYYSLHRETCKRTGARPHPVDFFRVIWGEFLEKGQCNIWFAEQDGNVIAACNTGAYKRRAHYWTGASLKEGQKVGANNLLLWTAIAHYRSLEYLKFDCGEAFLGNGEGKLRGLSDFKASFGGDVVPYSKGYISSSSKCMKTLSWARNKIINLRSR